MTVTDEEIGENVVRARGGLSQKDLASLMRKRGWKWSQATVWSIEKGERPLRLAEADELAHILEVDVAWLAGTGIGMDVELALQRMADARERLQAAIGDWMNAKAVLAVTADATNPSGPGVPRIRAWLAEGVTELEAAVAAGRLEGVDPAAHAEHKSPEKSYAAVVERQEQAHQTPDPSRG